MNSNFRSETNWKKRRELIISNSRFQLEESIKSRLETIHMEAMDTQDLVVMDIQGMAILMEDIEVDMVATVAHNLGKLATADTVAMAIQAILLDTTVPTSEVELVTDMVLPAMVATSETILLKLDSTEDKPLLQLDYTETSEHFPQLEWPESENGLLT